jgi:hypothetical protein
MDTRRLMLAGTGALLALAVLPAGAAAAGTGVNVPCSGSGGGAAGLITAITAANAAGGGTINLAAGCTYQLTAADNNSPMLGGNGLPVITSQVTLNGSGTTIAGNNTTFRILQVGGTGNLTVQGLTITGGNTATMGGGILNLEGTLTLNHSRVTGNTAPGGLGGGILNHGQMTIKGSTVTGNTALTDNSGEQGGGGGIANLNITPLTGAPDSGVLTLSGSRVSGNSATGLGGGILEDGVDMHDNLGQPGAPLALQLSQVTGNSAGEGGGIFASTGSPVTLSLSQVLGNNPDNCEPPGTIAGCTG